MAPSDPSFFTASHGTRIGYFSSPGKPPTVLFMGGLMSDMAGTKALHLERFCRQRGQGFLRFDYGGHGISSGKFEDGTIGSWHQDTLSVIDNLAKGPVVVIGSSMGGWQALLAALARPDRVKGLIGLAPAPDFTDKLLLANMKQKHKEELFEKGRVLVPSEYGDEPYIFTRELIEEGKNHALLDGPIGLDIPVRLIHGMADNDVPYRISLEIMENLQTGDAELILVREGNHKLSSPKELKLIEKALLEILERLQ